MCGICGFVSKNQISGETLEKMNNTMRHRGPDDSGIYIDTAPDGSCIGLGHRRLSILDLSSAGHQPMISDSGRFAIVYNGEIYNFKEIREQLEKEFGVRCRSNCDTEVILRGYEHWGEKIVEKCNGMFAFAIYDKNDGSLFIARDRMGQKPLYFYNQGTDFVFASELKPIINFPSFNKVINTDVLPEYFYRGYISGRDSIFKNTYRLMPGHMMFYKNGEVEDKTYWKIENNKTDISFDEAKAELDRLITDAVEKRLISDVPIGAFLSGGIDSSLITAIAQKVSDSPVKTYSIGFSNHEYDESKYARKIADYLKTDHHEMIVTSDMFNELTEDIAEYFDEPFADVSEIPSMLVSKFARQEVTVAISGDAGDELFGGYGIYDSVARADKYRVAGKAISAAARLTGDKLNSKLPWSARMLIQNSRCKDLRAQLWNEERNDFVGKLLLSGGGNTVLEQEADLSEKDIVEKRMHLDCLTYLPDDILVKVDRSSMKYSLESRSPLLDYRIVEYAFSLPQKYKYNNGVKKYILKDLLNDYVPAELFDRPKRGFGIPVEEYIIGNQKSRLAELTEKSFLERQGLFNHDEVIKLVEKLNSGNVEMIRTVWSFYMFQMWYCKFFEKGC